MDAAQLRASAEIIRDRAEVYGTRWNEAETLLAYLLTRYVDPSQLGGSRKRADGSSTQDNFVVELASLTGRTEDAVVRKIMNLRWFDTEGRRGEPHGSSLDRLVVETYRDHLDRLVWDATSLNAILPRTARLFGDQESGSAKGDPGADSIRDGNREDEYETTGIATVAVRRGHGLFRRVVLGNYVNRCAVCGIHPRESRLAGVFLRAGHIRPWKESSDHQRLDPRNGMSLCVVHDRAMEHGLMTLEPELTIRVSRRVDEFFGPKRFISKDLRGYSGQRIEMANAHCEPPGESYLEYHRHEVYERYVRIA